MKFCKACETEKPLDQFYAMKHTKDKKQTMCKDCYRVYFKGWRASRKAVEPQVVVSAKVCFDCGLKKPISQFGVKSISRDKHNEYCKPCWRERNKIAQRKYQSRLRENAKNR